MKKQRQRLIAWLMALIISLGPVIEPLAGLATVYSWVIEYFLPLVHNVLRYYMDRSAPEPPPDSRLTPVDAVPVAVAHRPAVLGGGAEQRESADLELWRERMPDGRCLMACVAL